MQLITREELKATLDPNDDSKLVKVSTLATQQASPDQPRHEPDPEPDPSRSLPPGTWTIDPTDSSVMVAWPTLRRWTKTRRLPAFGIIHLDELPPVGAIRFQQPSGLPVLTMALDQATAPTAPDLEAMGGGSDGSGQRWWTLDSQSLEVLPTGTWRIMATLTAGGGATLVELHLEVDPKASRRHVLVLRGRGVLDRRALGLGRRAWGLGPNLQLGLALHATRVEPAPAPSATKEPATTGKPGC
jgi:hypothetical protein